MKSRTPKKVNETWSAALRLFSGRRNPSWELTDECIEAIEKRIADNRGRQLPAAARQLPQSGYRGLTVSVRRGNRLVRTVDLFKATLADSASGCQCAEADDLARKVFQCLPRQRRRVELDDASLDDLEQAPAGFWRIEGIEKVPIGLECPNATQFIGDRGGFKKYRRDNNCYNYGANKLNKIVAGAALPGGTAGFRGRDGLVERFEGDGLISIGPILPARCPLPGEHYVAVVVRKAHGGTSGDFHVLRLDRNGLWSHKDGDDPVIGIDGKTKPISNLATALFEWPSDLLAFFRVPRNRIEAEYKAIKK